MTRHCVQPGVETSDFILKNGWGVYLYYKWNTSRQSPCNSCKVCICLCRLHLAVYYRDPQVHRGSHSGEAMSVHIVILSIYKYLSSLHTCHVK